MPAQTGWGVERAHESGPWSPRVFSQSKETPQTTRNGRNLVVKTNVDRLEALPRAKTTRRDLCFHSVSHVLSCLSLRESLSLCRGPWQTRPACISGDPCTAFVKVALIKIANWIKKKKSALSVKLREPSNHNRLTKRGTWLIALPFIPSGFVLRRSYWEIPQYHWLENDNRLFDTHQAPAFLKLCVTSTTESVGFKTTI